MTRIVENGIALVNEQYSYGASVEGYRRIIAATH